MFGSSCVWKLPRALATPENGQFWVFKVGEHFGGMVVNVNIKCSFSVITRSDFGVENG